MREALGRSSADAGAGFADRAAASLGRADNAAAMIEEPYRLGALLTVAMTRVRLVGGNAHATAATIHDAGADDAVLKTLVEKHIKCADFEAAKAGRVGDALATLMPCLPSTAATSTPSPSPRLWINNSNRRA